MHGLRAHNAWGWFWLVCAFCLSVKVVIWAVARIAALLQVLHTMRQVGERLLHAAAHERSGA